MKSMNTHSIHTQPFVLTFVPDQPACVAIYLYTYVNKLYSSSEDDLEVRLERLKSNLV